MICCYQNKRAILICFLLEGVTIILIHTTFLKAIFISEKILSVIILKYLFYLKKTPRDILSLFHDIAGLDMNLEEWKQLCHNAWENHYDFLQIDRFHRKRERRYTIRNCNKSTNIECTAETRPF